MILDTHVLIWWAAGTAMKRDAVKTIGTAMKSGDVAVSSISAWEIATLVRLGRLEIDMDVAAYIDGVVHRAGIHVIPIDERIAVSAGSLPSTLHGDPCDRIIVATALAQQTSLFTRDRRILDFARRTRLVRSVAV